MPLAPDPGAGTTRIAHVGLAVQHVEALQPLLTGILGLPSVPLADSDGAKIVGYAAGDSLVELLEPVTPGTPIAKYMEKRGAGIHHICFAVADLDATLTKCRDAGIQVIDPEPRLGAEGKRVAFLHPKSTAGILIELSEY
ncbi:MAG: methylmalonyl-CoA epimerase [Gemmatimonadetes bacterium]|nr:methylmalonyl-CoA epimerase [Gemmatimonadota bacterium]